MKAKTFAVLAGLTLILSAGPAHADYDFQWATSLNGGWIRKLPTLSAESISTSAREMSEGKLRTGSGLAMMGLSMDVDMTVDDRWKVLLVGGSVFWAVGSQDALTTSFDGSIATVKPWTTARGDLLLPGIGRRWKYRRNMWAAAIRTGVSFLAMEGDVAAGRETQSLELNATTFLVQLELEACRRLDPTTRACIQIVPRLYEHEVFNGITFGLRMEWGR